MLSKFMVRLCVLLLLPYEEATEARRDLFKSFNGKQFDVETLDLCCSEGNCKQGFIGQYFIRFSSSYEQLLIKCSCCFRFNWCVGYGQIFFIWGLL